MSVSITREPHDHVQASTSSGASNDVQNDSRTRKRSKRGRPKSKVSKRRRNIEIPKTIEINCPICQSRVEGSEIVVNSHIEQCVAEKESREQLEEYEWSGFVKIRTTYEEATRLAGSGLLRIVNNEAEDRNQDGDNNQDCNQQQIIDVEGDINHIYGPGQYNSMNGDKIQETGNAHCIKSLNSESGPESNVSKCAVCLDPLKVPVVSVNCWHVHCETCWTSALKVKKLCPRCTMITCFDDLRRVYL